MTIKLYDEICLEDYPNSPVGIVVDMITDFYIIYNSREKALRSVSKDVAALYQPVKKTEDAPPVEPARNLELPQALKDKIRAEVRAELEERLKNKVVWDRDRFVDILYMDDRSDSY